ncbi:MAG: hypothetical protein WC450_04990 [Candidatus Omnitrophota bacterium]|jgi:hypothetical protein
MDSKRIKTTQRKRNLFFRILVSLLWGLPFLIITNMIMGTLLGAVNSIQRPTSSFTDGYEAGRNTSREFFKKNQPVLLPLQIILWLGLCLTGKLPGTDPGIVMKELPAAMDTPGQHPSS